MPSITRSTRRRSRSRNTTKKRNETRKSNSYNIPLRPGENMYVLAQYNTRKTAGICGDFVVHKKFKVTSKYSKSIYGYVIQKIEKTTDVQDNTNRKITNIEAFTSDQVKYMNDSYYELFIIENGISIDGDNFQNGALLEYEYDSSEKKWYALDDTPTKGNIIQKGTSWFISDTEENVRRKKEEYEASVERRDISILGTEWLIDPNTPANGLPILPPISLVKMLEDYPKESNILEHTVTIEWNCCEKENTSNISSQFIKIA
jgi:hypothetical protein